MVDSFVATCAVQFGATAIPPQNSNVTARITAPTKVGIGQAFTIGVVFGPGPGSGPVSFSPGEMEFVANGTLISDGASSAVSSARVKNVDNVPGTIGQPLPIPLLPIDVIAPGRAGATVEFKLGTLTFTTSGTGKVSSAVCTRTTPPTVSSVTDVIADQVTIQTTTTAAPTSAAPTTTEVLTRTASTLPAGSSSPGGTQSRLLTKTEPISMTCAIEANGSNFTPQTSTVTAVVTAPDKVSRGQSYQVSVAFDPGPKNGPIRFGPGLVSYSSEMRVTGGATPANASTSSATNPDVVPGARIPGPDVFHQIPTMTTRVSAPNNVGARVGYTPSKITITISSQNSTTKCSANGSPTPVVETEVVAGTVSSARVQGITANRAGAAGARAAALAFSGSNSGLRLVLGTMLLVAGAGCLLLSRRRRD